MYVFPVVPGTVCSWPRAADTNPEFVPEFCFVRPVRKVISSSSSIIMYNDVLIRLVFVVTYNENKFAKLGSIVWKDLPWLF